MSAQPTSCPPEGGGPGQERLERLFRDHYAELCAFVYGYTRSHDVAEDIVQDLFMSVWKDPDRWAGDGGGRTLLFVAARNRALDHYRHRRVRDRYAQRTAAEGAASSPPPDEDVAQREIQQALDAAISNLPERARAIFVLSRKDGLTYRQIAQRLGLSVKTVETQMSRSLKKLRAAMAPFLSLVLLALGH
ncbi:MAG TPA: RNA polymerase sigma-70 factor [Longimicrobiales bacterium]|nr:RNA polymerase sigma-70 factor [Longimicrobiales bacterium]